MKKSLLLLLTIILFANLSTHANRSLYVDGFASILGDTMAENDLLNYAQNNEFETLLLYQLHIVNANYNLSDTATNGILADFIYKAKTQYGIVEMGATSENPEAFTNSIDAYNNSRTDPNEKFDIYNLEFEFWVSSATDPGGYYCTSYLTPNGLPCTNDGAFQYFTSTLQAMHNLADNNIHPITIEAYVGWITEGQADTIGQNVDRLLVHSYVSSPTTSFSYTQNRLIDIANGNPGLDVSIIFSSEPAFMQTWLENNSMLAAENIFTSDWTTTSTTWLNNINLVGFTYFNYTNNENTTLSVENSFERSSIQVFPNPTRNLLNISSVHSVTSVIVYNNVGQIVLESTDTFVDFQTLISGIYFVKIETEKAIEIKKVIKK